MTSSERRKIVCSVTFHIIAITCVVWSLYVLIDRTAEEIKQGQTTGMSLASCPACSLGIIIYVDKWMRSTSVQAVFPLRPVSFSLRLGWFKSTLLKS